MSSPCVSLADWLRQLPAPNDGHLLIGASGHLILSAEERRIASEGLRQRALPALISISQPQRVTLVTGLAPGADLLFKQVASDWLRGNHIEFQTVAVLPVPVEVLIEDWRRRALSVGEPGDAAAVAAIRAELETVLADCAEVVDLMPEGGQRRLPDEHFRQQQYRRLAALLAEQTDVLIALLRPNQPLLPGGTAEVVDWRSFPRHIPQALSTLIWRQQPRNNTRRLLLIDPTPPATLNATRGLAEPKPDWPDPAAPVRLEPERRQIDGRLNEALRQCRQAQKSGNYLLCYDLAIRAQEQGLQSRQLDYQSLLSLANAGSTQLALKRFRELNIDGDEADEDWLALEGRLFKDLARAAQGERSRALYRQSGQIYREVWRRFGGYFPAINAATTLLLAGQRDEALLLAAEVLNLVREARPGQEGDGEIAEYYLRVTEAEALLLQGAVDRARSSLTRADQFLRGDLNVRSRTASQLRLICRHVGCGEEWLSALTLAPVIHVPRQSSGEANIPVLPLGASLVFSGMTTPAELCIAERFLERQSSLHLVLPAPRERLIDHWQRHHGESWAVRLDRCIEGAAECLVAQGFLDDEDSWCDAYVSATACGLSRLSARRLGCRWQTLGQTEDIADDIADDIEPSQATLTTDFEPVDRQTTAPDGSLMTRRFIGTLFADFAGYSRLDDTELPLFQSLLIGSIAEALKTHSSRILLQHTWGDAVHVVTIDAASAATIAADIRGVIDRLRPTLTGTLGRLELRLAAHYAPVYEGLDPVEGTTTYFGSQLSFAARIEPITPPGMIFVTEAFAARLAIEAPEQFTVEYVGEIELAKRYGKYRLYSLRRADQDGEILFEEPN